ncbi:MAG: sulfatase [Puniceicoccaceae bacterium]
MAPPLNFLFLQCEDIGRHLGCYGDSYASTPNIDKLAAEGCVYTNAFTHSPVCAPSRGGMVTGRYPWTLGNHLMRCTLQRPPRLFTHELVDAGYHVSWPTKLDFNFEPTDGWCTDTDYWWEAPPPEEPFFLYRNFHLTHESRMFQPSPAGHEREFPCPGEARHDPDEAPVPPYLPDIPELRNQLATYYDALSAIDAEIGQCLQWLEDSGQKENTVVILLSDHGRGLPREKRWCYDAGLHVPLIVRWPGLVEAGSFNNELVAWVDIAPTILSLAGVPQPGYYQGQVFMGDNKAPEREAVFAGRDRMDAVFDKQRVVRERQFHYIRNDAWWLPWAQEQWYMEQQPVMPVMRSLFAEGGLAGDEAIFFQPHKPVEELYDAQADPDMLHNLADDPAHSDTLLRLRSTLETFLADKGDLGETDERVLIEHGIVTDRIEEMKRGTRVTDRTQTHFIGPRPVPVTLEEARAFQESPQPHT